MASEKSNGVVLPEDIIILILLRLKVKSLSRFKCVCKRWLAIIEDSSFINNHYNHPNNKEQLLIYHQGFETYLYNLSCYGDGGKLLRYDQPIHLQLPLRAPNVPGHAIECIIGPIAGVFCLITRTKRFVIWNPARRSFNPIPLHRPDYIPRRFRCYEYTYGCWFDLFTNEYKVVWIQSFLAYESEEFYEHPVVSVYSSIADSWRCFEDDVVLDRLRPIPSGCNNTYLNGFIYWWAERGVVAFDVSMEVFIEIQVPDAVQSRRHKELSLFKNTVALTCFNPTSSEESIDIWLMDQGGRWAKYMTIAPFLNWSNVDSCDNKLFLRTHYPGMMILYDVETRETFTLEAPETFTLEAPVQGWAVTSSYFFSYKESLVPVKRDNKDHEQFNRDSAEIDFLTFTKGFVEDVARVTRPTSSRRSTKKCREHLKRSKHFSKHFY